MASPENRPDIPSAADLVRLLDWTLTQALALRHASDVTIRERRRILDILLRQSQRLERGWKRLSWRFEGALVGTMGLLIQAALPEYLHESGQVLAATEMAGAFPDTERWRTLYDALAAGQEQMQEEITEDSRLSKEIHKKEGLEVWPLVGFENQSHFEETFAPSFTTLRQQAGDEEKRLLAAIQAAGSISEAELLTQGFTRETIIDTISALSKSKLVKFSEDSTFTLTGPGQDEIKKFLSG